MKCYELPKEPLSFCTSLGAIRGIGHDICQRTATRNHWKRKSILLPAANNPSQHPVLKCTKTAKNRTVREDLVPQETPKDETCPPVLPVQVNIIKYLTLTNVAYEEKFAAVMVLCVPWCLTLKRFISCIHAKKKWDSKFFISWGKCERGVPKAWICSSKFTVTSIYIYI